MIWQYQTYSLDILRLLSMYSLNTLGLLYAWSWNTLENFQACSLNALRNVTVPMHVQGTHLKQPKLVRNIHLLCSSMFREHAEWFPSVFSETLANYDAFCLMRIKFLKLYILSNHAKEKFKNGQRTCRKYWFNIEDDKKDQIISC